MSKRLTSESNITAATGEAIARAAGVLRDGGLVAFPTETVYGLGGDAANDRAIAAIYAVKGRPVFNPLIAHAHNADVFDDIVVWSPLARQLAARLWPGPLTMILPRALHCPVSLLVSAGLDTVAVRVPAHPVALALLQEVARPVAAPSANSSCRLSPTTAAHVQEDLGDSVNMILDGGATVIGVESTVVDMTADVPTILRYGGIAPEDIEAIIGTVRHSMATDDKAPRSPGQQAVHYSPRLPLRMNAETAAPNEGLLCFGSTGEARAVETGGGGAVRLNLSQRGDVVEAAANLFAMLRRLDVPTLAGIAVMPIPETGLGLAINDRLRRAASARS